MKETKFIEQNKEKWSRFEEVYNSSKNNPEELSALYMDMTEDLSYAQTFYKRRTVRVYLNQLAQRIFTGVHKHKGESIGRLFSVWKTSLPLEIYRSRKTLLFTLLAFLFYAIIGVITTHFNPDFPRIVMGDCYVNVTLENIQQGNPLAVYEYEMVQNPITGDCHRGDKRVFLQMFVDITTNNLKVAFLTFFVGFFFTIGTHLMLFFNGVMLGSFQYFFHTKGLLVTTFLGIWIHGAFEISAIVLAGGAGIIAGQGWLFPKSYTRMQSLQLSTKRALKIMMSLVPFIIAAGFLESFVTHNYQNLPEWSKWGIILFSFAIIIFYYVLYPIYVARKHPELVNDEDTYVFRQPKEINFYKIRMAGEAIADTFQLYRSLFHKFGTVIFVIVLPLAALVIWMQDVQHYDLMQAQHTFDWQGQLGIMFGYSGQFGISFIAFGVWSILVALIFSAVFWSLKTMDESFSFTSFFHYLKKRFVGIWLANLLLFSITFFSPWYILFFAFFIIPFFLTNAAVAGLDDVSFGKRWSKGFSFSAKSYGIGLVNIILLTLLVILFGQLIASFFSNHGFDNKPWMMSDLLDLLAEFVGRIALVFTEDFIIYENITRQFVYLIVILLVLPMLALSTAFNYFNVIEKEEAIGLKKEFEKFGKRKRNQESKFD